MAKLDDLPQELKELILCAAPDIATLECLAHSSPLFHGAYVNRREDIFLTVLSTEIPPDILHEARFVARATSIERGSTWFNDVKQLLADYDKGIDDSFPLNITLTETIYISRFLPALRDVSMAFFRSTLSHHPLTRDKMNPPLPTQAEMCRVQRSILRMETFSILFSERECRPSYRPSWSSPLEALNNLFFSRFELWEVEEIKCMRDFFYRQYNTIFRESSTELRKLFVWQEYHDLDPNDSMEKAAARTKDKTYSQYREMTEKLLSFGFEFLHEVMNENSEYNQVLLLEEAAEYGGFRSPVDFLSDTLDGFFHSRDMRIMQDIEFRETVLESQPTGNERPNQAWFWSIQQWDPALDGETYVSRRDRRDCLRSWGYVMWDSSRLESLGFMNCKIQDMQPHGPKAIQGPLLTDRTKTNDG
ncbi:uncharacterized protein EAE97_001712 [Botrytis byssoidea]|uniref:Uncharacterized protein n=1 Tax=Botrytis byssoidea TaxID=139641 RepID=A0A9P5LY68_9HELO|nr:uncharacterized protein EAE97_001712 [Botrytis byssoidea]KAF7952215.1 hypothetical protein EAE97_001712 [Botrytis byssoidea]